MSGVGRQAQHERVEVSPADCRRVFRRRKGAGASVLATHLAVALTEARWGKDVGRVQKRPAAAAHHQMLGRRVVDADVAVHRKSKQPSAHFRLVQCGGLAEEERRAAHRGAALEAWRPASGSRVVRRERHLAAVVVVPQELGPHVKVQVARESELDPTSERPVDELPQQFVRLLVGAPEPVCQPRRAVRDLANARGE